MKKPIYSDDPETEARANLVLAKVLKVAGSDLDPLMRAWVFGKAADIALQAADQLDMKSEIFKAVLEPLIPLCSGCGVTHLTLQFEAVEDNGCVQVALRTQNGWNVATTLLSVASAYFMVEDLTRTANKAGERQTKIRAALAQMPNRPTN